ncbi:MAG: C2H2-type zinc finger protein [Janthinobacterium lividum]
MIILFRTSEILRDEDKNDGPILETQIESSDQQLKNNVTGRSFVSGEKSFTTKQEIIGHLEENHQSPTIQNVWSLKETNVGKHKSMKKNSVNDYRCKFCSKRFTNITSMRQHLDTHTSCRKTSGNSRPERIISIPGVVKPFVCNICNKRFKRKIELTIHTRKHKGEDPFKCDVCGVQYSCASSLIIHHTRVHVAYKTFSCKICKIQFTRKWSHTGQRKIVCADCKKCYNLFVKSKPNQRIIVGVKPYVCNYCQEDFYLKISLIQHIRTHVNEKPYSCEYCSKPFSFHSSVVNHQKKVHTGDRPYTCNVCSEPFDRNIYRINHQRTHKN